LIVESGQQTEHRPPDNADEIRAGMHSMWGMVAPGWEHNADFVDSRSAGMTEAMLSFAKLNEGDRVLELACGPAGLGMAAAERVGPEGEVVLSDVAAEMTAIAAARARDRGLDNVSTVELDLERIDQPDDGYDAVLCREGIMLVLNPRAAAREINRVLKPGGRTAVSVWGPRERNPWLGAMLDAVGAQLGGTFPPPGMPGPFALDERDKLLAVLWDAGLVEVEVNEVETPWRGASFDQWWLVTSALAGPLAKILEAQPADAVEAIRSHAREALSEYESPNGLEIPGVTLVGSARRS
jgi:ubiquinone/menaquinone biosynthesis C-methylase UbiE